MKLMPSSSCAKAFVDCLSLDQPSAHFAEGFQNKAVLTCSALPDSEDALVPPAQETVELFRSALLEKLQFLA